jgi:hypothetical protein
LGRQTPFIQPLILPEELLEGKQFSDKITAKSRRQAHRSCPSAGFLLCVNAASPVI